MAKKHFEDTEVIFVATGMSFADALSGGPLAAAMNAPIVLVNPNDKEVSAELAEYIEVSGAEKIVVLGGEQAVNAELCEFLADALK